MEDDKRSDAPKEVMSDEVWTQDPDNARNWAMARRIFQTFVSVLPSVLVTMSTSIYSPGRTLVQEEFGVSTIVALLPLSIQLLGQGFGQVLAAPLSESFGRQIILFIATPLFALFTLGASVSQSFPALVVCRFFAGLWGATDVPLSIGILTDMWEPDKRALPFTIAVSLTFAASPFGFFTGSYLADIGWRWTQYIIVILCVPVLAMVYTFKETFKAEIMRRRRHRATQTTVRNSISERLASTEWLDMIRPLNMLITEPVVLVVSIYTSLAFAVIYGFFASIPYIFIAVYAFDQHQVGLVFVAAIVGYLCSLPTMLAVDKLSLRWFARKKKDGQTPSPNELALLQSMLGAPFFPISLFWLGWSARTDIHFMVPTVAVALYSWSSVQIYLGTISYLARIYGPKFGASAAAADRVLSFLFGVAFPLFTTQMYRTLDIGWATSVLAFLGVAMIPVPWVCYFYGKKLVARSRYERDP